jgi:glycosyltransferase involved in cell wall biosynthesis
MRILVNGLQAGNRSGTGVYTAQLARWLPRMGSDLDVLVIWPEGVRHPHLEKDAHQAFIRRPAGSLPRRIWYDQVGIRKDCHRLGANAVHYPASVGNVFGLRNMVLTIHDLSFLHHPEWYTAGRAAYLNWTVARSARLAARIVCVSQTTAQDVIERYGVAPERVDVAPNGVDDRFTPMPADDVARIRETYRLPELFILYVGTLEPRKNIVRLVQAFEAAASHVAHDLVLVGREGWKCGPLLAAIEQSPARERIHRIGHVEHGDLPSVLSAADAFAYPSLFEGFGLPVAEAMACGVPVLTSNVSSLPEVAGDAALLVDPYDIEALAAGLRRVAADSALRAALRERGPAQAARYTWERTAELTLAAYKKVLGL